MRTLLVASLVLLALIAAPTPAAAGKRPPLVVAVDKGDAPRLAKLLKKARKKDLDAFDADTRSPTAGMRAIEVAAKKADLAAATALLAAGATATAKAIELAAAAGQLELVQLLVDKGAPRADLAFTAAAKAGHVEVVEWLLPHARKADPYFNLDQVLEFALYFPPQPSAAVVKVLVREGAKLSIRWGPAQQTALHMAISKGAADVVAVLLAAGAPLEIEDRDGHTPLLAAVAGARYGLARTLLAAGADPRRVNKAGDSVLSLLARIDSATAVEQLELYLKAKVPIDHAGKNGTTALMAAAGAGSMRWVEVLLARGASPAARTADGRTAIDFALTCWVGGSAWGPATAERCHGAIAVRLLARPKAPVGVTDTYGRTPLVRAIMSGNDDAVARMLAAGMKDPDPDRNGEGPLHYVARYGTPTMLAAVLAAKIAVIDEPNAKGETPLDLARAAQRGDIEQALIAAGAH